MKTHIRKIIFAAIIAALYASMTMMFSFLSFREFQFRVAEVLTILPYFFPVAVPGLFVGCMIANILSPYGIGDVIIGSTATLAAALLTMRIGKSKQNEKTTVKALACLPPVVINAVFIGALTASFMAGEGKADTFWAAFALNAVSVGFGQSVVIFLAGLPLMVFLPGTGAVDVLKRIYTQQSDENEGM